MRGRREEGRREKKGKEEKGGERGRVETSAIMQDESIKLSCT